jgi:hypothetical protein
MRSTAPEWLRDWLEWHRHYGHSFIYAWTIAIQRVCRGDAEEWEEIFDTTRESWRRAYEGQPASGADGAIALLGADRDVPVDDERRCCERRGCDQLIEARRKTARFCSDTCRLRVTRERERERAGSSVVRSRKRSD